MPRGVLGTRNSGIRSGRSAGDPVTYWIGRLNRRLGWRWSRIHVHLYRLLGGRLVGRWHGRPIVLLTTTGRTSGLPRTTPITAMRIQGGYLAVASYRPQWFRNLLASPSAEIRDGSRRHRVHGRTADDDALREEFRSFYPALTLIEADAAAPSVDRQSGSAAVPLVCFTIDSDAPSD